MGEVTGRSPSPGLAHLAASIRSQERGIGHLLRAREIEAVARWIESSPSGDCPHGSCCEGYGYVISYIEHLLATHPKDSPEWDTAARIMDEVGK